MLLIKYYCMKKKFLFLLLVLLQVQFVMAQGRRISGIITSSDEELPLIGVTVVDKQRPTNGVLTGVDGRFTITVADATKSLSISYIGYTSSEVAITGDFLTIVMDPDVIAIDEVIVVAYGTSKKSTFTGSANVVKSEALEKIKTSNITQALQGQSSGVQVINNSGEPGSEATIRIRGISSINAGSTPLYVVDGTAYSGNMNAINPSDIESITILKDASATSLYGSRAANGVVMITTKTGNSEKGQINFRTSWGFSKLAVDLPRELTPTEFTQLTWRAMKNGYMDAGQSESDASQAATNNLLNELKVNPFSISNPVATNGLMDPNANLLYSGDWRNALFSSRLKQDYVLDFSGKNNKADYYVSIGYTNDKGMFSIQEFERYSTRVNLNYLVNDWVKIGSNINLSHSKREGSVGTSTVWFLRTVPTNYPIYEWDPSANAYKKDGDGKKIYDYGDNRQSWIGWNPLADDAYNSYPSTYENVSNRTYIEFKLFPGMTYRTNFSFDYYHYNYDGYTNSLYGFAAGYGGEASKTSDKRITYTFNNILNYNKTFGDNTISAMFGQEAYSLEYKRLSAAKRGFPFNGLTEINSASTMNDMSSYTDEYRLLSFFANLTYDFKDRYYLSGSFRTDGSSRFHPDSRWGNFWSVGGSWRMSNEEFMSQFTWIDNLKLRASYGAVGNDGLSTYYAYQGLYATGRNDYNYPGIFISRLPNKTLKWETNLQSTIGLDFTLLKKLNGSIEWFNRKSKDLLFPMPMAPSTGFGSIDRNIGDVKNEGFEFQLDYNAISKKDFRWTISLNGTTYKNTITSLPQKEMNSGLFKWREGESRYNFWMVEYAGVNPETGNDQYWQNIYETVDGEKVLTNRVKTENLNGLTSDDQKQYMGDAIPDLFGGFTNTLYYKGLDLSLMFYYSIGGKLYDGDYSQMMSYRSGFSMHPDMLDSWTKENTNAKYPRLSTAYGNTMNGTSTRYLYDNTFVRLKNLTLGYTLPSNLTKRFQVSKLRIYVQGDNFLTFGGASKRGTDPEQGVDGRTDNRFPITKSVSFGLQLSL